MRIMFAMSHIGVLRHFDGVVRHLCGSGHQVTALFGSMSKEGHNDRALVAMMSAVDGFQYGQMHLRRDLWGRLLTVSRKLRNYALYIGPRHPASDRLAKMLEKRLGRVMERLASKPVFRKAVANPLGVKALSLIERVAPPGREITRQLREQGPDVLVATPFIYLKSWELEYVKAARSLDIPTVVPVASWDHLTTKGTFQVLPDLVTVWNHSLAREAAEIHQVPEGSIFVTGSPTFDFWFELRPTIGREEFCHQVRVDPARPIVVYLCSSTSISGDETTFVREFVRGLREDPDTRDVSVIVRPHPLNPSIWDGFSADNSVVWPRRGDVPDTAESKQDYYHSLFYSLAVVGVNTTAMVEAAIVDRPCVAIMTDRYHRTQEGRPHFHHLLRADFMQTPRSFSEAAKVLSSTLNGADPKADNRRRFVREFIRPRGIDEPASLNLAHAIEAVARGEKPKEIPSGAVPVRTA